MAVEVSTPVYEGPFDLLLQLILAEQVDLYEVALAPIVDAYVAEVQRRSEAGSLDLESATEFLLIAATLVELKARRLLPGPDDVDLDPEVVADGRDLLLARLLECKTFKDAAEVLRRLADDAARSVPRTAGPDERFLTAAPDLLAGVTPEKLRAAYVRATTPASVPRVDLSHLTAVRASVDDAVVELLDELPRVGRTTFRRLTGGLVGRLEVVVRFLALLELCKRGVVDLAQAQAFGELEVVWVGEDGDGVERWDVLAARS